MKAVCKAETSFPKVVLCLARRLQRNVSELMIWFLSRVSFVSDHSFVSGFVLASIVCFSPFDVGYTGSSFKDLVDKEVEKLTQCA